MKLKQTCSLWGKKSSRSLSSSKASPLSTWPTFPPDFVPRPGVRAARESAPTGSISVRLLSGTFASCSRSGVCWVVSHCSVLKWKMYIFPLKWSCAYLEHFEKKKKSEDKSGANELLDAADRVSLKRRSFRNSVSIRSSSGTLRLLRTDTSLFSPSPIATQENVLARLAVFLLILGNFPFLLRVSEVVLGTSRNVPVSNGDALRVRALREKLMKLWCRLFLSRV